MPGRKSGVGGEAALRGLPGAQHFLVGVEELLTGLFADGLGKFGWPVAAAELYRLAEAFGKLDARRATGKVSFDLLAGIGRKLQVQIIGKQGKDFFAFRRALIELHLNLLDVVRKKNV